MREHASDEVSGRGARVEGTDGQPGDVDAHPAAPATERPEPGMDKRVDLLVALGFMAFGVWLLHSSTTIPQGSVDDEIGSGGFGRVLALIIIVLSGYVVVRSLLAWRRRPGNLVPHQGSADDPVAPASSMRAFAMFAALALYVWGVSHLGYLIITPVFVFIALWLMRVRSVTGLIATPLLYTAGSYALFEGVFGVLLPLGLLDRWDYTLYFHF
jgi:hypothetical protein